MTRKKPTLAQTIAATFAEMEMHRGVRHDWWTDACYYNHDEEWEVYCTPFFENDNGVVIVCQNHDGDVLPVVELSMGHNAHLKSIPENVEKFGELLPLIRGIAAVIIDHHKENA